jgi:plastocyanin
MLKQDDTFSITFEEAGAFDYYCAPHPYMKGRVVVEEGGA